jgi:hypothetical protein
MPLDFGWVAEQALQRDIRRSVIPPIVMRFAVHPEHGVLPSITNAVIVAEKVRQAVLKRHSDMNGTPASKRLAGKQHDGSERREGHDHPFFLPLDRRNRGVVDAVDIWLPAGCTQDEFVFGIRRSFKVRLLSNISVRSSQKSVENGGRQRRSSSIASPSGEAPAAQSSLMRRATSFVAR